MVTKADWAAYIEHAKSFDILKTAEKLGAKVGKSGTAEYEGPCPIDGGHDRFSINIRKQIFNCRGSRGGDIIDMVCHIQGCSIPDALERITGRPKPDSSRDETMVERAARMKENQARLEASRQREAQQREVDQIKVKKDEEAVSAIIDRAVPIEGTHGWNYMLERGLSPQKRWTADIRFVEELDYWGVPDNGAGDPRHLVSTPALIAIIRNVHGDVIGISQTFLDPAEPRKLRPPGSARNSAKKIRGLKKGGMIRLGRITETLALGEGWENPFAWHLLGGGQDIDKLSMAGAVDIGNLSGGSTDKLPHKTLTDPDGQRLRIMNGEPDIDDPGVIIPDGVKRIIIICDANSESFRTAAHYATATRRFKHHGMAVGLAWPKPGYDWNDVLVKELQDERVFEKA